MFRKHVTTQLSAYCHDQLGQGEARRVAEHLLTCQRCRKAYEEIKLGVQLASRLVREPAPETLWAELESRLDQAEAAARNEAARRQRRSFFALPSFKIVAASATLLLLVGCGACWFYLRLSRPSWEVTRLDGSPKVGWRFISAAGRLAVGEWLVTDHASRARIDVGGIGQVEVEPNSQVQLLQARAEDHRLSLRRGKMHAFIWAPPRQFYVDTPSAVAVDLGCAYTLEVNDDGQALLSVTSGWVAFEQEGRESFVPQGARCVTRPGFGPGTPYFSDASEEFKAALAQFDVAKPDEAARAAALAIVLAQAGRHDALTLWHLLSRTNESERGQVYDQLAKLIPPPPDVTRAGVLRGDQQMLDAWWEKLALGSADFWRRWKGPVPK